MLKLLEAAHLGKIDRFQVDNLNNYYKGGFRIFIQKNINGLVYSWQKIIMYDELLLNNNSRTLDVEISRLLDEVERQK